MKRIPALTVCLLLATALPASATTYVVNSLADTAGTCGSDCTLRQPIAGILTRPTGATTDRGSPTMTCIGTSRASNGSSSTRRIDSQPQMAPMLDTTHSRY